MSTETKHPDRPGGGKARDAHHTNADHKPTKQELDDELDEALEESFPASDPASITRSSTPGKPNDRPRKRE